MTKRKKKVERMRFCKAKLTQIQQPVNEFSPILIPNLMFHSGVGFGGNVNEIIKTFPCFFNFQRELMCHLLMTCAVTPSHQHVDSFQQMCSPHAIPLSTPTLIYCFITSNFQQLVSAGKKKMKGKKNDSWFQWKEHQIFLPGFYRFYPVACWSRLITAQRVSYIFMILGASC